MAAYRIDNAATDGGRLTTARRGRIVDPSPPRSASGLVLAWVSPTPFAAPAPYPLCPTGDPPSHGWTRSAHPQPPPPAPGPIRRHRPRTRNRIRRDAGARGRPRAERPRGQRPPRDEPRRAAPAPAPAP